MGAVKNEMRFILNLIYLILETGILCFGRVVLSVIFGLEGCVNGI